MTSSDPFPSGDAPSASLWMLRDRSAQDDKSGSLPLRGCSAIGHDAGLRMTNRVLRERDLFPSPWLTP